MCKAKAEGGFRCAHHAGQKHQELLSKFRESVLASLGDSVSADPDAYHGYDAANKRRQEAVAAYESRSAELKALLDSKDYQGYIRETGSNTTPERLEAAANNSWDTTWATTKVHDHMRISDYAQEVKEANKEVNKEVRALAATGDSDLPGVKSKAISLALAKARHDRVRERYVAMLRNRQYADFNKSTTATLLTDEDHEAAALKSLNEHGLEGAVNNAMQKTPEHFDVTIAQRDLDKELETAVSSRRSSAGADPDAYMQAASTFMESAKGKKLVRALAENDIGYKTPGIAQMKKIQANYERAKDSGNAQAIQEAHQQYQSSLSAHNTVMLKNQFEAYDKVMKSGKTPDFSIVMGNNVVAPSDTEAYRERFAGKTVYAASDPRAQELISRAKKAVNYRYEEKVSETSANLKYQLLSSTQ